MATAPKLLSALPAFLVRDVRAAVTHYRDVLGFHVPPQWQDADEFAIVDLAPGEGIHFKRAPAAPAGVPSLGAFVRTSIADLAERHAALVQRGAQVIFAPEDKPWGMREFTVRDPDGHQLRFAAEIDRSHPAGPLRLCPEIPAKDASAAVSLCQRALGFELRGAGDDLPYFGIVGRDQVLLHWHTARPVPQPNRPRADVWDVCIEVTGVDALADSLRARGAELRRGPVTTNYGMREFEAAGPEGRSFCFTEDLGG